MQFCTHFVMDSTLMDKIRSCSCPSTGSCTWVCTADRVTSYTLTVFICSRLSFLSRTVRRCNDLTSKVWRNRFFLTFTTNPLFSEIEKFFAKIFKKAWQPENVQPTPLKRRCLSSTVAFWHSIYLEGNIEFETFRIQFQDKTQIFKFLGNLYTLGNDIKNGVVRFLIHAVLNPTYFSSAANLAIQKKRQLFLNHRLQLRKRQMFRNLLLLRTLGTPRGVKRAQESQTKNCPKSK